MAALSIQSLGVHAEDLQVGGTNFTYSGTATVGTSVRTTSQNPILYPTVDGVLVGLPGGITNQGHNLDDGNLNFGKGKPVSTVAKATLAVGASNDGNGFRLQGYTWYDYTLENGKVPWGNFPGGYHPGLSETLSDEHFSQSEKFANVRLLDAYIFGKTQFDQTMASGRLGNQVIDWGSRQAIPGGLFSMINAIDFNAALRPGAQPDEVIVRMPAAYAKLDFSKNFNIEAFYQFANTTNQLPGCGTFFSGADYVTPGCNRSYLSPTVSDPFNTVYNNKSPGPINHDLQFGVGGNYRFDSIATRTGLFFARVDSRNPLVGVIASTSPTTPLLPNGAATNGSYFIEYAKDIDVFSANFTTSLKSLTINGEATIKHNAPLSLTLGDLQNAFVSYTAASELRADQKATGLGGVFHAFDLYDQGYFDLNATQVLPGIFAANRVTLNGDVALKNVFGLPDVNVRRYGRSDLFAANGFTGTAYPSPVCPIGKTLPVLQCTNAGYVTAEAWGYRLNASFKYDDVLMSGLQVTPSIGFTHDVYGWSGDAGFSQGRMLLNLGVRTDYKNTFATLQWNPAVKVGAYDIISDRQIVTIAAGIKY